MEIKKEKVFLEIHLTWGRRMPFIIGGCCGENEPGLMSIAASFHLEVSRGKGGQVKRTNTPAPEPPEVLA